MTSPPKPGSGDLFTVEQWRMAAQQAVDQSLVLQEESPRSWHIQSIDQAEAIGEGQKLALAEFRAFLISFVGTDTLSEKAELLGRDVVQTLNTDFQKTQPLICKVIEESKRHRAENSGRWVEQLKSFEEKLDQLDSLAIQYYELSNQEHTLQDKLDKSSSDDGVVESNKQTDRLAALERAADEANKRTDEISDKIQSYLDEIIKQHADFFPNDLQQAKAFFSDWWTLNRLPKEKVETSLAFIHEQVLNRCVNRARFLEKVNLFIENNKTVIIAEFCRKSKEHLDSAQLTFELIPTDAETHNRGEIPVIIDFKSNGNTLFKIVYKPRDASVDECIIKLFRRFNDLPVDKKSFDVGLPVYKTLSMKHGSSAVSLWEFIEGEHRLDCAASAVVSGLKDTPRKKYLSKQLLRLEQVCRALSISDLHNENIIFQDIEGETAQIVPIDLESIQPDSATGLYAELPDLQPFTKAESELLDASMKEIKDVPYRLVPVESSRFLAGLTRCDSFISVTRAVMQSLKDNGFSLTVNKEHLESLILNDFLHNDVPYFSVFKSKVHYGRPNESIIIAGESL